VEGNKGRIVIRAVISLFSSCSHRCIRVRRKGRRRLRFVIVVDTWKKRSARQLVSVFSSFFFVFVLVVLRVLPSTRFAAARGVAVQVAFERAKFVTGFSRWVKGQAQGLEPVAFKLWVSRVQRVQPPTSVELP
jgi:hypothetical protein